MLIFGEVNAYILMRLDFRSKTVICMLELHRSCVPCINSLSLSVPSFDLEPTMDTVLLGLSIKVSHSPLLKEGAGEPNVTNQRCLPGI